MATGGEERREASRMSFDFTDRMAVVTGAAHGFGRAIAAAFAASGARVWACDVLATELKETQRLIGGRCSARTLDVTDRDAVQALIAEAEAAAPSGAVDILVNNAGGVLGDRKSTSLHSRH